MSNVKLPGHRPGLKISPRPSLPKRGNSSLLQREGRRDLLFGVYIIMG